MVNMRKFALYGSLRPPVDLSLRESNPGYTNREPAAQEIVTHQHQTDIDRDRSPAFQFFLATR